MFLLLKYSKMYSPKEDNYCTVHINKFSAVWKCGMAPDRWHPIMIIKVDAENFELSYVVFIIEYSSFSNIFERFSRTSEI